MNVSVDRTMQSRDRTRAVDVSDGLEDVPVLINCGAGVRTLPEFQYTESNAESNSLYVHTDQANKADSVSMNLNNVEGPGCTADPSEVTLPGCCCRSLSCCTESCSCLKMHGQAYDGTGTLLDLSRTDSGYCSPVFECNTLCSCGDTCFNRVVQRGLRLRLEVYSTGNRGWGVRTLESIPRGIFVCEYAGEVISFGEARRRQLTQRSEENNYIIAVREHAGTGSVMETFVDPAVVGNVGRFLNHSCEPNLLMLPVRVHSVVPRLALFAGRDIEAHEELTFDYSGGYSNQTPVEVLSTQSDTDVQANRTQGVQRKACLCGANKCAVFLPLDLSILK